MSGVNRKLFLNSLGYSAAVAVVLFSVGSHVVVAGVVAVVVVVADDMHRILRRCVTRSKSNCFFSSKN